MTTPDTVAQSGPTPSPNPVPAPAPVGLSSAIAAAAEFAERSIAADLSASAAAAAAESSSASAAMAATAAAASAGAAASSAATAAARAGEATAASTAAAASATAASASAAAAATSAAAATTKAGEAATSASAAAGSATAASTSAGAASASATTAATKAAEATSASTALYTTISGLVAGGVAASPLWLDGFDPAVVFSAPKGAIRVAGAYAADTAILTVSSGTKRVVGPTGTLDTVAANTLAYDWSTGRRRLLVEAKAATNIFLNSGTGATQSLTLTAGSWTLSFWGTGSIALSGSATGTLAGTGAANRVSLTVTATAGSCTVTVTGSCTNVQMESGAAASSYVPTTSSAATRIADDVRLSAAALAAANAAGGATIVLRGRFTIADSYARILGDPGADAAVMIRESLNDGIGIASAAGSAWLYGGASLFADFGACAAFSAGAKKISKGSVAPVSSSTAFPTLSGLRLFGGYLGGNVNGFIDEIMIWPLVGSNAAVLAQARAYS
jgi:hypothetical protein